MENSTIKLWDLPIRLFHWLLVLAVVGAIVTVKLGGNWMIWHERFGLTVLGLIVFRIMWGFVGSSYARFSQFLVGPRRTLAYLRGEWHQPGHNPLGALSVMAMLLMLGAQATSGLFAYDDIAFGGPLRRMVASGMSGKITGWHQQGEWLIYGLIALHLCAVLFYTLIKKDNLVGPMITGRKQLEVNGAQSATGGGWVALSVSLLVTAAVVWVANGGLLAPPPPPPPSLGW
ncbi:MAG: cytochrome b/b6 domain-containing protein [Marinobacter sp.]|nr:cytochrome b/b6 domain-containing protein [Marinobacter sp.]